MRKLRWAEFDSGGVAAADSKSDECHSLALRIRPIIRPEKSFSCMMPLFDTCN